MNQRRIKRIIMIFFAAFSWLTESAIGQTELANILEIRKKELRDTEKEKGPVHSDTIKAISKLGEAHFRLGQYEKAAFMYLQALNIQTKTLDQDDIKNGVLINNLGLAYHELGKYSDALPLLLRALEITEKELGAFDKNTGLGLNNVALTYSALGNYAQARDLQLRALEIFKETLGNDHQDTNLVRNNLGYSYYNLGDYEKALQIQTEVVSVNEAMLGSHHRKTAISLGNLGLTLSDLGRHEQARPHFDRALKILEKTLGEEHSDTAIALNNLARFHANTDDYKKALALQLRAVNILKKNLGIDHPNMALAMGNLADIYLNLGEYVNVISTQKQVLSTYENIFGNEHPKVILAYNNIAQTYIKLGEYSLALSFQTKAMRIIEKKNSLAELYAPLVMRNLGTIYSRLGLYEKAVEVQEKALAAYEKRFGSEHAETGISAGHLAVTLARQGQLKPALAFQTRSLHILQNTLGLEHSDTVIALNDLAQIHSKLGKYDLAHPLQIKVLEITKRKYGVEHENTSLALNNLAQLYMELNLPDKALPLLTQAIEAQRNKLGPSHPDLTFTLNNIAGVYAVQGDHETARELLREALGIAENSVGKIHPIITTVMNNLALREIDLNRPEIAKGLFERALAISEKTLGPTHLDTALILNNLAQTYITLGNHEEAIPYQIRALTIAESNFDNEHVDLSLYHFNLSLSLKGPSLDKAIFLLKSAVNQLQLQRSRITRLGPQTLTAYTQKKSFYYQELANRLIEQGRLSEAQTVLDMLKEEEHFSFIRRSPEADPRKTRIGYNATEQQWLDRYRRISSRLVEIGARSRELDTLAKQGLSPEQVKLRTRLSEDLKVAESAFQAYIIELREDFSRKGKSREVEYVETSQKELTKLKSLIGSLGEGTVLLQIYLTEHAVNFILTTESIQVPRSIAIENKELNRRVFAWQRQLSDKNSDPLPAAQALYKLLLEPVQKDLEQARAKTVMLSLDGALRYLPFGALHDGQRFAIERWNLPIYTSTARERLTDAPTPTWQAVGLGVTRSIGDFKPLPAVKDELQSIVRSERSGVLPGEVYLDQAFTAARFKSVSDRKFPVIHVASHFQLSAGTEINSFLLLGDGERLTLGDLRTQNYRFDGVDLLTLSACDTGLGGGRDQQGKEIEGFGVIAQQQGAKAVLATLWQVADRSTATLMGELYRLRQSEGLEKIEALRQAQLFLKSKPEYQHPYFWAPFILMGNWK